MRIICRGQWRAVRLTGFQPQASCGEILCITGNTIGKLDYAWWMRRMEYCFCMYDLVRVDHFRGFDEYYAIPYGDATAEYGRWEKGPGLEIFRQMQEHFGGDKLPIIAEDLGFLTRNCEMLKGKRISGNEGTGICL